MIFNCNGINNIAVHHDSNMEGGGTWFGQEYVEIISQRYPGRVFDKCFEWCSGPGFIGFSLLDHGLCQNLCLSDIYSPAIDAVRETARTNHCQDQVSAYVAGSIALIPETEKFDLVVANPPHYLVCPGDDNYQRIAVDKNWDSHRDFFQNIAKHMTPDGIILLQENQAGSLRGVDEFWTMIHCNYLKVTAYFTSPNYWDAHGPTQIYYIEIRPVQDK